MSCLFLFYENLIWKYSCNFTTFTTMKKEVVTIKVYDWSRASLKTLAAMQDRDMIDTFELIVSKELQKEKNKLLRKQSNKK